jgi:hypothetical protein
MGSTTPGQVTRPESSLAFERGRLLNLIDSRIRRNEMEAAKGLAEELFKTEIRFALLKKTKVLARYNSLLLRVILGLIGVLVFSTALTVLNIRPAFSLVIELFSVLGIISAVVINSFLVRRFEKGVKVIMEVYENQKQCFIERVLACGMMCRSSEDWQRLCVITAIE